MTDLKDTPIPALIEQALALSHEDPEAHERWEVLVELRRRDGMESFAAAKRWCASNDGVERELGADLLGQLGELRDEKGREISPFTDQSILLLETLLHDAEARVVASAVSATGKYHMSGPILARPALADHPSSEVRWAVASSLDPNENIKAVTDLLIKLSGDGDDDVRNWATFELGIQSEFDTVEIREALIQRLDDQDSDTRSEARVGLARRKDARVIPHIQKALMADSVTDLEIEAAGQIASPDLVKPLEEIYARQDDDRGLLKQALNRCKGAASPDDFGMWVREGEIIVPAWATEERKS